MDVAWLFIDLRRRSECLECCLAPDANRQGITNRTVGDARSLPRPVPAESCREPGQRHALGDRYHNGSVHYGRERLYSRSPVVAGGSDLLAGRTWAGGGGLFGGLLYRCCWWGPSAPPAWQLLS